ncbi:MAG: DUF1343 domain-containing protein [Alistipes sp.]|nr:DUF1343 domain-containing protein [Alistipes sp.]
MWIFTLLFFCWIGGLNAEPVVVGAERTEQYLPLLKGKRVGVLTNPTGRIGETHLVDSLVALGVDLQIVFAPEHGFRGDADAGEQIANGRDARTGVPIVSVYGANKQPGAEYMAKLDVVLFDIQDVGLRYYTYLSSLHYLMQACAASGVRLIVLDRPNPNGFYVDGPILDPQYRSFVGMHPIPVVHGMTLGELARMINGEGWLDEAQRCKLTVIPCLHYTHQTRYALPVKPSPNLPNLRSIYLYPSLCYFEGTPVSVGRGTDFPFQCYGHPALQDSFRFTPHATAGAKNPPLRDQACRGVDLRELPSNETLWQEGVNLSYVIACYRQLQMGDAFFTPMFEKLIGVGYVRQMIEQGADASQIKTRWSEDVERFRKERKPYLLYEE